MKSKRFKAGISRTNILEERSSEADAIYIRNDNLIRNRNGL